MKPDDLNYRHLLYFWAVAKEGSITRAADRLGLSVQTISTQISMLERQLGQALFAPQGRLLALTDAGRTALRYAEQIFHIGGQLRHALSENQHIRPRFTVGVTDAVPKLISFRLLDGVLLPPHELRLECIEGAFEHLLGELALNRLDLVIADHSAPQRATLKLDSHLLGNVGVSLYGRSDLIERHGDDFPNCLNGAPILLPSRPAPLRDAIDGWLETHDIRPEVVGEFSDSALLKTFGRAGRGFFPAPVVMQSEIMEQFQSLPLGELQGVSESWYAISTRKRVPHPAVVAIRNHGGSQLLAKSL